MMHLAFARKRWVETTDVTNEGTSPTGVADPSFLILTHEPPDVTLQRPASTP